MEAKVYCLNFKNIKLNFEDSRLFEHLPQEIQEDIICIKDPIEQRASFFGKCLLQVALINYGFSHDAIKMMQNDEFGRPYINNKVDFNISHSGDCVAVAVSNVGRIGIDLEENIQLLINEYENFFTKNEWHYIIAASDRLQAFYQIMTRKESILKCIGQKDYMPINSFSSEDKIVTIANKPYYCYDIETLDSYTCSISSSTKLFDIEVKQFNNIWC